MKPLKLVRVGQQEPKLFDKFKDAQFSIAYVWKEEKMNIMVKKFKYFV
jgi:hypothetical protein